jgi:hypothetical protein
LAEILGADRPVDIRSIGGVKVANRFHSPRL